MKRKAFTLIELIAVITIIGLISLLVFPIVINTIDENKEKLYKKQIDNIENIAYNWIASNNEVLGYNEASDYYLTFEELKISGYLKDTDIKNPKNSEDIKGCIKINWNNESSQYAYNFVTSCPKYDDEIKPTVVIEEMGNLVNSNGWAKTNINLKVTIIDNESGAKNYKWCVINGESCTPGVTSIFPNGIISLTEEGENNKICIAGYDNALNQSDIVCSNIYKIDKTKPSIEGLSDLSVIVGRNPDLTNDVTANDMLSGIDGTYTYESDVNKDELGSYSATYKVKDKAGNEIVKTRKVMVIASVPTVDFTPISNPFNEKGWAKDDFEIKVNAIDNNNKGIRNIKYCKTTEDDCTPNIEINSQMVSVTIDSESASNKICVIVEDNIDKKSPLLCSSAYKLDKTMPVISGLTSLEASLGSVVNLTNNVSANDSLSGVDGTYLYSPMTIDTNIPGSHTVTYTAYDNAGNINVQTRTVVVLAKNPEADFSLVGNPFNGSGWAKENFEIKINATDYNNQGMKNIKYCVTTASTCTPNVTVVGSSATVLISTESSVKKICTIVEDNIGKQSSLTCSSTYKLDKTVPSCVSSGGTTSWRTYLTLTGTCSDSNSGCTGNASKTYAYEINSTTESPGLVYDNAGNSGMCPANQTVRIDATAPTVSFSPNGNSTPSQTNSTKVTVSDAGNSGIKSLHYAWSTSYYTQPSFSSTFSNGQTISTTINSDTVYYLWIRSEDNAGNITIVASNGFSFKYVYIPPTYYYVYYNAGSGSGAPATTSFTSCAYISSSTPSKSGYSFSGWSTSPGGSVVYGAGSYYCGSDITLYAKYCKTVTTTSWKQQSSGWWWCQGARTAKYSYYTSYSFNSSTGMFSGSGATRATGSTAAANGYYRCFNHLGSENSRCVDQRDTDNPCLCIGQVISFANSAYTDTNCSVKGSAGAEYHITFYYGKQETNSTQECTY